MSDDRLAGIEQKLDVLVSGQVQIESRLGGLETGQVALQSSVTSLQTGQATLHSQVADLQAGQAELRAGLVRVETRLDKVEVRQEEMADHIKQIAEGHGATQAAIERAAQAVCSHIDERIKPLEDMARVHFGTM